MNSVSIEQIQFSVYNPLNEYIGKAHHEKGMVGIIKADFSNRLGRYANLYRLFVVDEYRRIGIADNLIQQFESYCESAEVATIIGVIMRSQIKCDTPEHVASYLAGKGYSINGSSFTKKLGC